MQWLPLTFQEARKELEVLKLIARQGLKHCWPVPPNSGWEFAKGSLDSRLIGEKAFRNAWEGGFTIKGEREKAEMQVSFGFNCDASDILNSEGFEEACSILYNPLIKGTN